MNWVKKIVLTAIWLVASLAFVVLMGAAGAFAFDSMHLLHFLPAVLIATLLCGIVAGAVLYFRGERTAG